MKEMRFCDCKQIQREEKLIQRKAFKWGIIKTENISNQQTTTEDGKRVMCGELEKKNDNNIEWQQRNNLTGQIVSEGRKS